jgi:hypothetical protein
MSRLVRRYHINERKPPNLCGCPRVCCGSITLTSEVSCHTLCARPGRISPAVYTSIVPNGSDSAWQPAKCGGCIAWLDRSEPPGGPSFGVCLDKDHSPLSPTLLSVLSEHSNPYPYTPGRRRASSVLPPTLRVSSSPLSYTILLFRVYSSLSHIHLCIFSFPSSTSLTLTHISLRLPHSANLPFTN